MIGWVLVLVRNREVGDDDLLVRWQVVDVMKCASSVVNHFGSMYFTYSTVHTVGLSKLPLF